MTSSSSQSYHHRYYQCWGQIFPFVFVFLHLLVIVYSFSFSLSRILLIMLPCYVLYVNLVIQFVMSPFFFFYQSLSVQQCSWQQIFFLGFPSHQPLLPSAFGKRLRFHRFSLIWLCSGLQAVCLYCNYYFLLFVGIVKHLLRHRDRVVFPRIGPCLFSQ